MPQTAVAADPQRRVEEGSPGWENGARRGRSQLSGCEQRECAQVLAM